MSKLPWFYRWWVNALPHRLQLRHQVPHFLRSSPEPFRGEVLELGAGHGWTSRQILKTFPQVELTAVDIDQDATKYFAALEMEYGRRLKVRQANIFQLPFDRESFDLVIAINVFNHLKPYSARKAVEESLRVLRPGGLLGLSDKMPFRLSHKEYGQTLRTIFEEEGCDILTGSSGSGDGVWVRKPYPVSPEEIH